MVFLKIILFFIIFLFKFNSKSCCCYKNNNSENNIIDNSKDNKKNSENIKEKENEKNKDDQKIVEIIKNNEIYKKDIKTSKFSWNNNNCTIKTSLLNLMLFFDNCPKLFDDIKKEENIICKRAKKEALEIIKEIKNIREKYLKGENLIRMEDFYYLLQKYTHSFIKSIKNEELDDINILNEIENETMDYSSFSLKKFPQISNWFLELAIKNYDDKNYLNKLKNNFINYRDVELDKDFKIKKETDFSSSFRLSLILKLLSKFVKDFYILEGKLLNRYSYKQEPFRIRGFNNYNEDMRLEDIKNLEINDQIISIHLNVKYGTTLHACLIFRDKDNCKKWYFDCCDNVIEIDFEDVKNKNFQKILDIWAKKCNSYNYTFKEIEEILYKN